MTMLKRPSTHVRGFTLIELLVVIAIISILATIAVPNIIEFLRNGNFAKAVAEIDSADTALTLMLGDAGRTNFLDFLAPDSRRGIRNGLAVVGTADEIYTASELQATFDVMFYELLRRGKEAGVRTQFFGRVNTIDIDIDPEVRRKLGTSYFNELVNDPWGEPYHFWLGPIRRGAEVFLRAYRTDGIDGFDYPYEYTQTQRSVEQEKLPGQPEADGFPGYPAPRDKPVFIYSSGPNLTIDANLLLTNLEDPEFAGGGDDVSNWDNTQGWKNAPRI